MLDRIHFKCEPSISPVPPLLLHSGSWRHWSLSQLPRGECRGGDTLNKSPLTAGTVHTHIHTRTPVGSLDMGSSLVSLFLGSWRVPGDIVQTPTHSNCNIVALRCKPTTDSQAVSVKHACTHLGPPERRLLKEKCSQRGDTLSLSLISGHFQVSLTKMPALQ